MTVETRGEWLTIPVAALRLNVSVEAVRRRLRSGELRGRRVTGQGGQRWEVLLGETSAPGEPALPGAGPARASRPRRAGAADERWLQLMRELLAENGELGRKLSRLSDERAELYGRCGYLQGQLAAAQAQIRALEAPRAAAAAEETARRPWWRLFRVGRQS
jgi:hypothetical protein